MNKFYISSPPNKIHISSWGNKKNPLCLFLHGWMDNSASFESVINKLKKNWFCIAPDLRGFGKSKSKQVHFWFPEYLYDLDNVIKSINKKKNKSYWTQHGCKYCWTLCRNKSRYH